MWNSELETIAQRWSDQCQFGHDSVRDKLDGTWVGQNAFWAGTTSQMTEGQVMVGVTRYYEGNVIRRRAYYRTWGI